MGLNWTILLLVGVLLGCGNTLDWFGSGNWTYDNMTYLRAIVSGLLCQSYGGF